MPRPLRPDVPNRWYHLMNRGADRQDIFSNDVDLVQFEGLLADAVDRFGIEIHAYCLMTNHFHLVVHCPIGGLSRAMQSVERRYTQSYNERYRRDGPLFRGRFHSVDITTNEQLARLTRYVHRNPLAFVSIESLAAYRWSSYGVYLGRRRPPPWLALDEVTALVGSDVKAHRSFVETPQPTDELEAGALAMLGHHLSLDRLVEVVAAVAGVDVGSITSTAPGRLNAARTVALMLATELRLAPTTDLADRFHLATASSVRTIARRGRVAATRDPGLSSLHGRVLDALFAQRNLLRSA